MTISHAIERLTKLQEVHGDVEVLMDCPYCGQSTAPTRVVAEPIKVKLTKSEEAK